MRFGKIKRYLEARLSFIVFACLVLIVYTFLGVLCAYPIDLLIYMPCLGLGILAVLSIIDYKRVTVELDLMENLIMQDELDISSMPISNDPKEIMFKEALEKINRQMKDIQSEVNEKQEEKSEVLTCWIHQIKTPVSALKLLAQNSETEEKENLLLECMKIEHYLDMILQMIRLDEYENDLVITQVDVEKIVRSAIRKNAKSFILKNIKIEVDIHSSPVLSDEKYLQFVIEQILQNSLKYTMSGEISIHMDQRQILTIKDTGIGISSQDLPRVFEKGFTGYNGRFDKKATGIGLYLVKQILDRLQNKIEIESEVNQGTTIRLNLYHKETIKE